MVYCIYMEEQRMSMYEKMTRRIMTLKARARALFDVDRETAQYYIKISEILEDVRDDMSLEEAGEVVV